MKNYFHGYYYKCEGNGKTIAVIPSLHQYGKDTSAFLQLICGDDVLGICTKDFDFNSIKDGIRIENSLFSENKIEINIDLGEKSAIGTLTLGELTPPEGDIMGPFSLIPGMQCKHAVYSMKNTVNGELEINGKNYIIRNGAGYIEGDRGHSFPERYVWSQCFFPGGSLMLSAADVPFAGKSFTGVISCIITGEKEYRLATYNGAKAKISKNGTIYITQQDYVLTAKLIKSNPLPLTAPKEGMMTRTVHESAACTVYYRFSHRGKAIVEFVSSRASFEFEY